VLILDSGAVMRLSERTRQTAALLRALRDEGLWPPVVPTPVLVECLQGHAGRDAPTNRFLKTCDVVEELPWSLARRAAFLRTRARKGSAVDALVVAYAEPGATVLTTDLGDLGALAAQRRHSRVRIPSRSSTPRGARRSPTSGLQLTATPTGEWNGPVRAVIDCGAGARGRA